MKQTWKITAEAANRRLDLFVAEALKVSRSRAAKLIEQGLVTVNGQACKQSTPVEAGDNVLAEPLPPAPQLKLELAIVYEDGDLMVVDKPAGVASQPVPGRPDIASVTDFTRDRIVDREAPDRPGLVHRLDRQTSGLLIIAKTAQAKQFLQQQFKLHAVTKTYKALVVGHPKLASAEIRLPLARGEAGPLHQTVRLGGRESVTRYEIQREYRDSTLVLAWPQTGRTHQIRVHFRHIGHPVVGDQRYGAPPAPGLTRHFLHASALQFTSPAGQRLELASPLPPELQDWLQRREQQV